MDDRPLILLHGYSDSARGFAPWRSIIESWGRAATSIWVGNYVSLTNEVTVKDLAEGLDRALTREAGLGPDQEFDAIVHSTGMLVVRSWLNSYSEGVRRRARLKHLVALAPATNGSPLAHKGRSWIGALLKGSKKLDSDFLEAGDEILYGLELASAFTWDLAHDDLIDHNARFRPGDDTPFVFTFCGNRNYGFLKSLVTDEEGTDGTVRWAGCTLNTRKITIDMTVTPGSDEEPGITISEWANQEHPLIFVDGVHHGSIVSEPPAMLQELVREALGVESAEDFRAWNARAKQRSATARKKVDRWQQFVLRVVDERGDPVTDWNAYLFRQHNAKVAVEEFTMKVHPYRRDPSLRCFHVNLDALEPEKLSRLYLRLMASSGTRLVAYHGAGSDRISADGEAARDSGAWDAKLSLTRALGNEPDADFSLFYPFTTTFLEIRLNREPLPMVGRNEVLNFQVPAE